MEGRTIHITGVVQGVGFRPYVCLLAERLELTGWVRNTSSGVDIEIDGHADALNTFVEDLKKGGPPRASIESFDVQKTSARGYQGFQIMESLSEEGAFQPVSPDISTCDDCLVEMLDPGDRRYRYPFINCTNCGPRFTIIRDIPYDRPNTTMASFEMCGDCTREYLDPADRRFHAQPIACPVCGPNIWVEEKGEISGRGEEALSLTRQALSDGKIVAVKGLGGFHLACDAASDEAVSNLRKRKEREEKPFALMAPDIETIERFAQVTENDRVLLESPERPIVLIEKPERSSLSPELAPGINRLGFMLPYTPLHYLLLEPEPGFPEVLVMTSGNLSEEPIAYLDDDARRRLTHFADLILFHDRPVHMRCDDPVVSHFRGDVYFFRRSRGYSPFPILLPFESPPSLATGGEFKNSFCMTRENRAFVSHYIGEMDCLEAYRSFEEGVEHYQRLFRIEPEILACDLHPDYQATRYARKRAEREGLEVIDVQHHHAHIASCMADNDLSGEEQVIGVAFDGTGYGTDGAIWGGEFLIADYESFSRAAHLEYCPLPGGDAAIRNPYRTALSWLRQAGLEWSDDLPPVRLAGSDELQLLQQQLDRELNTPPTSSMGRLFDAVASIAGIRHRIAYEAQAACELEAVASPGGTNAYPFAFDGRCISPAPLLSSLVSDVKRGLALSEISSCFHNGVAEMVAEVCRHLRRENGIELVALSGGVWQNLLLLNKVVSILEEERFTVYTHRRVPANDGGLALGQAAVAARRHSRTNMTGAL